MSNYRRWYVDGGTYFFTLVTYDRRPLFAEQQARDLLGECFRTVRAELPFETIAIALMPDHLHTLWQLPSNDDDFSTRWKRIKAGFTSRWLRRGGTEAMTTKQQARRGNRGVWQKRFYEHLIRDEFDLENHFHYIHYNPVKHGHVFRPCDWEPSTFRKYADLGYYAMDWGSSMPMQILAIDLD